MNIMNLNFILDGKALPLMRFDSVLNSENINIKREKKYYLVVGPIGLRLVDLNAEEEVGRWTYMNIKDFTHNPAADQFSFTYTRDDLNVQSHTFDTKQCTVIFEQIKVYITKNLKMNHVLNPENLIENATIRNTGEGVKKTGIKQKVVENDEQHSSPNHGLTLPPNAINSPNIVPNNHPNNNQPNLTVNVTDTSRARDHKRKSYSYSNSTETNDLLPLDLFAPTPKKTPPPNTNSNPFPEININVENMNPHERTHHRKENNNNNLVPEIFTQPDSDPTSKRRTRSSSSKNPKRKSTGPSDNNNVDQQKPTNTTPTPTTGGGGGVSINVLSTNDPFAKPESNRRTRAKSVNMKSKANSNFRTNELGIIELEV